MFEHLRLHPSVLVVDDLHWADQGTIDLLRFLLRRIRITSSLVVGALRDDEIGATHPLRSLLGDVARSPDADVDDAAPLSVDAVAALVEDRPVDPDWLHRLTGGNPFFVVEMLDHDGGEIPRTVRDAILARTSGLDADAWDLLHLLACAPEAIPDHLLARLGIGLPALRAVDDAGLIRRGPRGVAFRHDLCRIAISGTLPPGGEVSFHRRMLDALESSPHADPAVLAHHAVGAGDAARTLRHATDAGRAAARSGAHTQAAAFFRDRARAGRARRRPADEAELLELLADEYYLIDRLDDAIAASERAMRAARAQPATPPASASTTTRCRCTSGTTPTATSPNGTPPRPWPCSTATPTLRCRRRTSATSATPWRCRPTSPCRPTTSTRARLLIGTSGRGRGRRRRSDARRCALG